MKLFDRTIQGLLAIGHQLIGHRLISHRLIGHYLKLKLFMIVLEKLVRAATYTPINFTQQTLHGELSTVVNHGKVQTSWHPPNEGQACVHHTSNPLAEQTGRHRIEQPLVQTNQQNNEQARFQKTLDNDCNNAPAVFSRNVDSAIKTTPST